MSWCHGCVRVAIRSRAGVRPSELVPLAPAASVASCSGSWRAACSSAAAANDRLEALACITPWRRSGSTLRTRAHADVCACSDGCTQRQRRPRSQRRRPDDAPTQRSDAKRAQQDLLDLGATKKNIGGRRKILGRRKKFGPIKKLGCVRIILNP